MSAVIGCGVYAAVLCWMSDRAENHIISMMYAAGAMIFGILAVFYGVMSA